MAVIERRRYIHIHNVRTLKYVHDYVVVSWEWLDTNLTFFTSKGIPQNYVCLGHSGIYLPSVVFQKYSELLTQSCVVGNA